MTNLVRSKDEMIESAWSHRSDVVAELSALAAELPTGSSRQETDRVLQAMQACRSAGQIAQSPVLLRWLPSLLPPHVDQSQSDKRSLTQIPIRAERLALAAERQRQLRKLWTSPLMLLIGMTIVFGFFCAVVVPPIRNFFAELELEIGTSTRFIFAISQWLDRMPVWLLVAIGVLLVAMLLLVFFSPPWLVRRFGPVDAIVQGWDGTRKIRHANFGNDLADLVTAGVELETARNYAIERFLYGGSSFATELTPHDLQRGINQIPQPLRQLVPEDLGTEALHFLPHPGLLRAWATIYDNRVLHQTAPHLLYVASCLMHLAVGWAVLVLVVAIYGPVVQLIQGLT